MGITADEFFENIYNVIFNPKSFFDNKDLKMSVRLAVFNVILIAVIYNIAASVFNGTILLLSFWSTFIFKILGAVVFWLFVALFFEYIAKIYSKDGNLTKILFYTAFAPIPYIFFAPLNLIKHSGLLGYFIGTLTELILYLWIIFLYAHSLRVTYDISLSRSFMLIFLPFISVFFAIYWLVCFFTKIGTIFSI